MEDRKLDKIKSIALVAHDHKKIELLEWASFNKNTLVPHTLYGTGTTAKLIKDNVGLEIVQLLSGPLGGDQQIGSLIADGKLDVLIFFCDPMAAQPHDTDVKALIRLCGVWNVPMATNKATADFLISSPLMHDEYICKIPDYTAYKNRKI